MKEKTELMNYKDLRTELENRLGRLKQEQTKCLQRLEQAPQGTLRANTVKKRYYFYHVNEAEDNIHNGTYIRRDNMKLLKALAQKEYDRKFLKYVEKEIHGLEKYLSVAPEDGADSVYKHLGKGRVGFFKPVFLRDKEFIKNWKKDKYNSKEFDEDTPEYFTRRGERVRSKSEILIANTLDDYGIPYKYEKPLSVGGRTLYPDFTVLNVRKRKEYIYEHLGMMDDEEYSQKALRKIANYESAGFFLGKHLILTYETGYDPLSTVRLKKVIQQYLL